MNDKLADFLEVFTDTNKTAVMAILLILGCILRIKGYVDGGQLTELLKTTTVSYFATTTVSHFTSMAKDHLANKLQELKGVSADAK
jgi:hypothetical protein